MASVNFKETIIAAAGIRSLCWHDDVLVDWLSGGRLLHLDGTLEHLRAWFAYRFDAAQESPSGKFVVLYERLGTKAILLKCGKFVRELNRSYYHADDYEYPITFVRMGTGREAIAHCPKAYNWIDIEDAETGRCTTDSTKRTPSDVFHSRLACSPDGKYILSAGWVWQPFDIACLWRVDSVLADPTTLDKAEILLTLPEGDVSSAAFVDDSAVIVGIRSFEDKPDYQLFVDTTATGELISHTSTPSETGTLYPVGDGRVIAFYEHPRLIDTRTGRILHEWPNLRTGKQTSSILRGSVMIPPFACHPTEAIFAVADSEKVTVVWINANP